MDFIEHLPPSLGFTAILVIVDRLTKQGVFVPTHNTITAAQLVKLFVLHIFSKHGVPSHERFRVCFPLLLKSRKST